METPDPPSDTPGASKKAFLTPHDIPRILRVALAFVLVQIQIKPCRFISLPILPQDSLGDNSRCDTWDNNNH